MGVDSAVEFIGFVEWLSKPNDFQDFTGGFLFGYGLIKGPGRL